MPSVNVVRTFYENGVYHIFNRGVEKRNIFLDDQDKGIFLYYLFVYLGDPEEVKMRYPNIPIRLQIKNLNTEVELLAYCMMPNHFHLVLKQSSIDGISKLMKQLTNAYTKYFNDKYKRVGGLVQGRFKAVEVENEEQLVHLSRYVHLNPLIAGLVDHLVDYSWSSYRYYLSLQASSFCSKEAVMSVFNNAKGYQNFIEDQVSYARELGKIKHLSLDE